MSARPEWMNLNPRSCCPSKSIPAPRISQKIDVPKPKIAANRAVAEPYFFQKPVKKINAIKESNKKIPATMITQIFSDNSTSGSLIKFLIRLTHIKTVQIISSHNLLIICAMTTKISELKHM